MQTEVIQNLVRLRSDFLAHFMELCHFHGLILDYRGDFKFDFLVLTLLQAKISSERKRFRLNRARKP